MKKTLLLASLLSAVSLYGQTVTEPTAAWANLLIGKPGQDQGTTIVTDGKNQIYWMLTDGSTSDDRGVEYAGTELYQGAMFDGSSSNKNLTILKTDAAGAKQWVVYSAWGDFSPNEGGMTVKPNGDIVFTCGVRHTDGYLSNPITIVDAKGTETTLDWSVERRWDQLLVGTISSEGELKWVRTYTIDHAPVPGADGGTRTEITADAINVYGVAVDDEDNIFVCGNFRTVMTMPKADNTTVELTPKNVTGWNGDSQAAVGSFYLVKLDQNGYYLNNLAEGGDEITCSYLQDMKWVDGKLYIYGYMKGQDNATVTVGGVSLTPTADVSPIVGCLDSDLNVSWIKCYPGEKVGGKNAVQNVGMTVSGDNIWLAGQYNGKISDPTDASKFVTSTQGNLREAFVIKLAKADGAWINAANSRTDFTQTYLTGYFDVVVPESDPENVYVYGYAMNANVGVFLRCYNRETLVGNPDKSWNIVTQGGVPTCQAIAYEPASTAAYVIVRGNKAFQPMGGELTANPGGYSNLLARFNLPEQFTTGIENITENTAETLSFATSKGTLTVTNSGMNEATVIIYDLTGRNVATVAVPASSTFNVTLPSGLYLTTGKKFLL